MPGDGPAIVEKLKTLLGSESYAQGAHRYAQRHCGFNPQRQAEQMLDRMRGFLER